MPTDPVDHPRKIIRERLTAVLKGTKPDYATAAGRRVYDSRDIALDAENSALPATLVYTERERILSDERHEGGTRRRMMTVAIEHYDTGDDAAQMVDRLAWQAEELLRADSNLGGLVESIELTDTRVVVVETGSTALFCAAQTFDVVYWTHFAEAPGESYYPPREVLLGFSPEVGIPNREKYQPVTA